MKIEGSFPEFSVETSDFVKEEAGGQFGFRCVSRKTYYVSDRTHILNPVYFETCLHVLLIKFFVSEFFFYFVRRLTCV